jgi:hypothetical protein
MKKEMEVRIMNTGRVKMLMIMMCAAIMVFSASPAWAIAVTGPWNYASPIDSILGYEFQPTPTPTDETTFANAVLTALSIPTVQESQLIKQNAGDPGVFAVGSTSLTLYDPGFSWVYAVVKVDGPNDFSYLFWDNQALGGDDLLTTPAANTFPYNMIVTGPPTGPLGISHVSFFAVGVPEPTSLLLLGSGLIGLALYGRKKFFKK